MLEDLTKDGGQLSGEDAFKLYDTYGFPFDLTVDILAEKGMTVDEAGFKALMEAQRQRARDSRKASDGESWKSDGISFEGISKTEFVGYTENTATAKVVAIAVNGQLTDMASEGTKAIIVLDKTPFYGEGGGQVGDTGVIKSATCNMTVTNTTKSNDIFTHMVAVESGAVSVGDTVEAAIDQNRRSAIRRNHTAAHLLQAALRAVLGTHVEQAGQLVNNEVVRFDFTHFSALTAEELSAVENLVNEKILSGINIMNEEMPIEEAKKLGAMALFGEKYGDRVRVVAAHDFSVEFCGGTHVDNSAKIGLFKIVSESSVAAGVRRIEAVTGANVLGVLNGYKAVIDNTAAALKSTNVMDIANKARQVAEELREAGKKIEALESKLAGSKISDMMNNAAQKNGIKIITAQLDGMSPNELRSMCDQVKGDNPAAVCLFAAVNGEKLTFCAAAGADAIAKGANAGNIVRQVAQLAGGNGGGKPDSAMAGGKDVAKAADAVAAAKDIIAAMIGD
jgi:alanyl-tRNA synthetase